MYEIIALDPRGVLEQATIEFLAHQGFRLLPLRSPLEALHAIKGQGADALLLCSLSGEMAEALLRELPGLEPLLLIALPLDTSFPEETLANLPQGLVVPLSPLPLLLALRTLVQGYREFHRSIRLRTPLSLLFIDLDYFKLVNDTYGHQRGSQVLKEIALVLKSGIREMDLVARYGGDEFVVLLPDTDTPKAYKVAERLRQTVENHTFLAEVGLNLKLTASLGVASFPDQARDKEELLKLADQAMYRAKGTRRNMVWSAADLLKDR